MATHTTRALIKHMATHTRPLSGHELTLRYGPDVHPPCPLTPCPTPSAHMPPCTHTARMLPFHELLPITTCMPQARSSYAFQRSPAHKAGPQLDQLTVLSFGGIRRNALAQRRAKGSPRKAPASAPDEESPQKVPASLCNGILMILCPEFLSSVSQKNWYRTYPYVWWPP